VFFIVVSVLQVMRRRQMLRGLVAAGGMAALGACLDIQSESVPTGDPSRRPDRQHAWNDRLPTDDHGNHRLPEHHVLLSLAYEGSDREGDRSTVETALADLERAYEASADGLLFTLGYTPAYFERFGESPGADLPPPGPLHDEENVATEDGDAVLHLASDHAGAVLAARQALLGERDTANGVSVTPLDGLFTVTHRRTGFVGPGLPAENDENKLGIPPDAVDGDAPNYMNFRSGFRRTQATEERVTLQSGRFAGGTTQHVEAIRLVLSEWFERSTDEQVSRLFSPELDPETVGEVGENLTDDNRVETVPESALPEMAREHGVVGHVQKMSHLREDGRPPILRRDVNSGDNGEAGMLFISLQRAFEDYRRVRLAMAGLDLPEETPVGPRQENGIRQYFRTRRRGNVLVPPRESRSLP
jgi:deferrochelatase/peroxidase EfeB